MADVPKVVVITRTRDRPILLRRAMESVLAQEFSDWQHVVVNDGGDPELVDALAEAFAQSYAGRLLVIHQPNMGMQKAANAGIEQSDSTYITIHDDDDSWHPDFLKRTTAFLNRCGAESPYQGVISKTIRILEKEEEDGTFSEIDRAPYIPLKEINLFRVGYDNPFSPIAFLYRRSAHDTVGYFDPRWDMVADLDFNFRFLQHFEIGVVDKPLAYYHWRDDKASGINANTVTRQKKRHGLYLNELKNHYMRQAGNAREAAIALGLQISAYAVENQWMTVEIREKTMQTHLFLESILQKIQALQEFNAESLWPKVTGDVLDRLDGLHQSLQQFEGVKQQLESLIVYNAENAWPKLADLSSSLDSLRSHIEEIQASHVAATGKQFENLQTFNHDALWPKLVAFNEQLAGLDASVLSQLNALHAFNEKLWQKQVVHEESIQNLHKAISATWQKQVEGNADVAQLREEVRALKEENKRQWQLGRLRLQWLPRVRKSSSNDSEG